MNRSRLLALPIALLLLIAATRHPAHPRGVQEPAPAASPQAPALNGTFTLASSPDVVTTAITTGTASMNFIKRPIARSRLKKTNLPPYQTVKFEYPPNEVSIQMDTRKPVVTPADGKSIKWTREDGEVFDVTSVWEGGALRETFVAGDGSRENLFEPGPDGQTMTLQVTIRSPQLKQPIVYKLDYRKKA